MVEELAKQLGALEKKAVKQQESESVGVNVSIIQNTDEDTSKSYLCHRLHKVTIK